MTHIQYQYELLQNETKYAVIAQAKYPDQHHGLWFIIADGFPDTLGALDTIDALKRMEKERQKNEETYGRMEAATLYGNQAHP